MQRSGRIFFFADVAAFDVLRNKIFHILIVHHEVENPIRLVLHDLAPEQVVRRDIWQELLRNLPVELVLNQVSDAVLPLVVHAQLVLRPYLAELLKLWLDPDGVHFLVLALRLIEISDVAFWLDVRLNAQGLVSLLHRKARGGRHGNHVVFYLLLWDVGRHALFLLLAEG